MEIEKVSKLLSKYNGWVDGLFDDVLYFTTCGCDEKSISTEEANGWTFVSAFEGEKYTPSERFGDFVKRVVYKRTPPPFYFSSNPWSEKKDWTWLPDLCFSDKEENILEFTGGHGGHGSPYVIRTFQCACSNLTANIFEDFEGERYITMCMKCASITNAFSFEEFEIPKKELLYSAPWEQWTCSCGCSDHILHYAIEYPVETDECDCFSWLELVTECQKCGQIEELMSKEIL